MKKLLVTLMFGMLLLINLPISAGASNKVATEKEVLINFLEAVKNEDINVAVELVNDNRFGSIEEQKQEYKYLLSKEKLTTYMINEGNNNSEFIVDLNFDNGGITKVPFKVLDNKVSIDFDSLQNKDFKVIQEGTQDMGISARHTLCDWYFSQRRHDSSFYSNCEFDISGTSVVKLLLTQQTDSTIPQTPNVTYAIVKPHWYGDDVWGSVYVSGTKTSAYETYISGKNDSFKGAKMRFSVHSLPSPAYYEGVGSLVK